MYRAQIAEHGYGADEAWKPIASLLLACGQWRSAREGWEVSNDAVFYQEANVMKPGTSAFRRGSELGDFLARELGFDRQELCSHIGLYWADPRFQLIQPHNLVGHAFRSLLVEALTMFGDPGVSYEEEVDPLKEFRGFVFPTRSNRARLDIVARRGDVATAIISSRWRFRHDRVEVVEEALAYGTATVRINKYCKQYAWVGEFLPSRLEKIVSNTAPNHPNPALAACVHLEPRLLTDGVKERPVNGQLRSLEWLIGETHAWR